MSNHKSRRYDVALFSLLFSILAGVLGAIVLISRLAYVFGGWVEVKDMQVAELQEADDKHDKTDREVLQRMSTVEVVTETILRNQSRAPMSLEPPEDEAMVSYEPER